MKQKHENLSNQVSETARAYIIELMRGYDGMSESEEQFYISQAEEVLGYANGIGILELQIKRLLQCKEVLQDLAITSADVGDVFFSEHKKNANDLSDFRRSIVSDCSDINQALTNMNKILSDKSFLLNIEKIKMISLTLENLSSALNDEKIKEIMKCLM